MDRYDNNYHKKGVRWDISQRQHRKRRSRVTWHGIDQRHVRMTLCFCLGEGLWERSDSVGPIFLGQGKNKMTVR